MNIDKSLYVPPSTQQSPYVALDVRRTLPVVKVGAILDVLVARQHNRSNYTLQLGREFVQASSEKPLVVGSRQSLKVVDIDPQGKLTTQLLTANESRIAQALQLKNTVAQPLSTLMQQLAAQPKSLPPAAQHWLDRIIASIPQRQTITQPQQLAQALKESGIFLESRLAQGNVPVRDFKVLLLNLWQQLGRLNTAKPGKPLPQSYAPASTATANTVQAPPAALTRPTAPQSGQQSQPSSAATYHPGQTLQTHAPLTRAPQTQAPAQPQSQPQAPSAGSAPPAANPTPNPIQLYQQVSQQNRTTMTQISRGDVTETPQSLLRAVESGLARLEAQQLNAAQARENNQLLWLLELPVRNGDAVDVWQFALQRESPDERKTATDSETHYRVSLNIELGKLGELAIEIDYSERETRFMFYSKNADVLTAIKTRGDTLLARLNSQGIAQPAVETHFGEGPGQPPLPAPTLDTRA